MEVQSRLGMPVFPGDRFCPCCDVVLDTWGRHAATVWPPVMWWPATILSAIKLAVSLQALGMRLLSSILSFCHRALAIPLALVYTALPMSSSHFRSMGPLLQSTLRLYGHCGWISWPRLSCGQAPPRPLMKPISAATLTRRLSVANEGSLSSLW